jgi:hypothetical protein
VSNFIFALYFDQDQEVAQIDTSHMVFGASNASKLLIHIPTKNRADAATTISPGHKSRTPKKTNSSSVSILQKP